MHKLSDGELDNLRLASYKDHENDEWTLIRPVTLLSLLAEILNSRKSESTHGAHRIANRAIGTAPYDGKIGGATDGQDPNNGAKLKLSKNGPHRIARAVQGKGNV